MTTIGTKYRGTKEYHLVYCELIIAAQYRGVVGYDKIAKILGIDQPGHHMAREVGQILGEISEDEHKAGRPMLSSVAVGVPGYPGDGYFELARRLGKLATSDREGTRKFWLDEKERVYETWKVDS
ncbi:MAG: hypothetical protein L0Z46_09820 [Nitrospiraceae bacterium]|nr:hypothetical protein [Nitrospiraceae bacterium]